MWPDWVSNPGPLTYESGTLPIALRGPATKKKKKGNKLKLVPLKKNISIPLNSLSTRDEDS